MAHQDAGSNRRKRLSGDRRLDRPEVGQDVGSTQEWSATLPSNLDPVTPVAHELDARIRAFRCGDTVDSFAVVSQRYLVVVDTMVNLESMQAVMDLLGHDLDRQILVVNTHGDWDHVWGNALFAGQRARYSAPIIGHRRTADIMSSREAADFLESYKAHHPGRYDTARLCPPSVCFDDQMCIDGGDLTLELIPTPGHTPDHLSVWIPELRLILTGDAAEMPPWYRRAATSRPSAPRCNDWRISTPRMFSIATRLVLPIQTSSTGTLPTSTSWRGTVEPH